MQEGSFGSTSLRVSRLGLGCARIGGIFQQNAGSFVDLLEAARDRGLNFFDTADMYSQGESETLLGKAFRRKRDRVVIATKAGYVLPAQRRWIAKIKPFVRPIIKLVKLKRENLPGAVRGELAQNFAPDYLKTALEASLKRLRTDYVDVLQLHSAPAEIVRRGEWARALEDLKRAGKVRYYGITVDTLEAAEAAVECGGISSLQLVVNLLEQGALEKVLPRAKEKGIAIIARETLANGLLVKRAEEIDLASYCSSREQEALRTTQLAKYRKEANEKNVPLPKLALDWVTAQPAVSVSLVGARNLEQLDAVLRAFNR